eukprot:IDg8605t1
MKARNNVICTLRFMPFVVRQKWHEWLSVGVCKSMALEILVVTVLMVFFVIVHSADVVVTSIPARFYHCQRMRLLQFPLKSKLKMSQKCIVATARGLLYSHPGLEVAKAAGNGLTGGSLDLIYEERRESTVARKTGNCASQCPYIDLEKRT